MENRLKRLSLVALGLFGLLALRLAHLQLIQGRRYARLSERNHIRRIVLSAPRGRIFDRGGRLLADSRPSFTVSVIPTELNDSTLTILSELLDVTENDLSAVIQPLAFTSSPVAVRRNLDLTSVLRVEESQFRLAGVRVSVDPIRRYPAGKSCCHAIGHLGEVTRTDLEHDTAYRLLDYIGRDGIEAQYEKLLRGQDGYEYIEVDARGHEIGTIAEKRPVQPIPGHDLHLTIDLELQDLCLQLTSEYERCGIVGLNVRTGAVLCLVSKPVFDPAMFLSPISGEEWTALNTGQAKPFFNRVTCAGYPPGSVLKPLVALAALRCGAAQSHTRFLPCHGSYQYGNRVFNCWSRHGSLDLLGAITNSCNVYFYQLGLALGLDSLCSFCSLMPLGRATGIDLPAENPGNIPSRAWLDSKYGAGRWTSGLLLNFAIGQGEILATPLQLAKTYAAIANNGVSPRPYLLAAIDSAGRRIHETRVCLDTIELNRADLREVKLALERVVTYGTARAARLEKIAIAGKTGTAQNPGTDHAWFVGYAPADDPEVVFAVLVENAGHGGVVAAPIASRLIQAYYREAETETLDPSTP